MDCAIPFGSAAERRWTQTKDHLMEETQRRKAIRRFKTKKHAMGRVLIPFLNHLRAAKSDDATTQNTHC